MFHSIVIPLDGSELADRAMPYAALLAEPGAHVALVAVIEPVANVPVLAHGELDEEEARMRHLLAQDLDVKAAMLAAKGFVVTADVRIGDPADEILHVATTRDADLIALTTHGRMGFSHWLLGSVASRVVQFATVPTLIIRPDMHRHAEAPPVITSLILPLDGSEVAAEAIPVVREVAQALSLHVECVRAVDDHDRGLFYGPYSRMYAYDLWEKVQMQSRDDAERYVGEAAEHLRLAGVSASATVLSGLAADALAEYMTSHPHALAIMTTHGRSGVSQWLYGSVTAKLATSATIPILILRSAKMPQETASVHAQAYARGAT